MPDELVPPHDQLAEQSVLGAMLTSPEAVWEAFAVLDGADFYDPRHELVFGAVQSLNRHGKPVDMVSVGDELQRVGLLKRAGDLEYLAECTSAILSPLAVAHYSRIVRDHALRRRMIEESQRIMHAAYAGEGDAAEVLEAGRTALDKVVRVATTDARNVRDSFWRVVKGLEEQPKGVTTPWYELDSLIVGLIPGKLYVVGGRPGEGKTIIGLQLARSLCVTGPVAFSSLEMGEDELTERLISSMADVPLGSLTRHQLTDEESQRIGTNRVRIENMPLYVDATPDVTITHIKSWARSVARKGGTLGGVVVDYLQLISGTDSKQKKYEIVSEVSRQLKIMAKELDCPVIALSQLNRESAGVGKMRREPTLADLRESGSIEQDADVVLLLQRQVNEDGSKAPELKVIVAKNRSGREGRVSLRWEGAFARVVNRAAGIWDAPAKD